MDACYRLARPLAVKGASKLWKRQSVQPMHDDDDYMPLPDKMPPFSWWSFLCLWGAWFALCAWLLW